MIDSATIFISYSHQDEEPWKDFVVGHLKVAERQGIFEVWDDRQIKGGDDWKAHIDTALGKADIAVLLISRHFLTSDFIMDHGVQTMLRRRASGGVILYPILISDCTWESVDWLKGLNIRPTDGTPLNSFDEPGRDQVMTDIASEIGHMLHPAQERKTAGTNQDFSMSTQDQRRRSSGRSSLLNWWRSAGMTARATVLGTVFAGLAIIWGIMSGVSPGGDQINANCSSVNTGTVEGAEINVDC
ncbi:MAG: toll/interleukin-1 receptor domain-containing protein [Geminicoccaceae bacterium]